MKFYSSFDPFNPIPPLKKNFPKLIGYTKKGGICQPLI